MGYKEEKKTDTSCGTHCAEEKTPPQLINDARPRRQ